MRKLFIALSLSVIATSAFAAADVKIDSYTYVNTDRKIAELCGTATNTSGPQTFIQITVDERSKRPAIYNTWAGPTGKFCTMVLTYYGTAIAEAL